MVASETGHVYTFATPKLQPMITSDAGKALIQTCLHQPDPIAAATHAGGGGKERTRMSSTGYEETELGYMPDGKTKVSGRVNIRGKFSDRSRMFTNDLIIEVSISWRWNSFFWSFKEKS